MSDPGAGTTYSTTGRTRKRFLEASEAGEDDSNARRPNFFNDWPEPLKNIGVPNKKGYTVGDAYHRVKTTEDVEQGLAENFEDSLSGLGVNMSIVRFKQTVPFFSVVTRGQADESVRLNNFHEY